MEFSGFTEKLHLLMATVFSEMQNPVFREDRFVSLKKGLQLDIQKLMNDQLYLTSFRRLSKILKYKFYDVEDIQEHLDDIHFDELVDYYSEIKREFKMRSLFVGNIKNTTAMGISNFIIHQGELKDVFPEQLYQEHILKLEKKKAIVYREINSNLEDTNHVILNYYQVGPRNIYDYTRLILIS